MPQMFYAAPDQRGMLSLLVYMVLSVLNVTLVIGMLM
jgi:hypothetical protein